MSFVQHWTAKLAGAPDWHGEQVLQDNQAGVSGVILSGPDYSITGWVGVKIGLGPNYLGFVVQALKSGAMQVEGGALSLLHSFTQGESGTIRQVSRPFIDEMRIVSQDGYFVINDRMVRRLGGSEHQPGAGDPAPLPQDAPDAAKVLLGQAPLAVPVQPPPAITQAGAITIRWRPA